MSKPQEDKEAMGALVTVFTAAMAHRYALSKIIQDYQKEHNISRDVVCAAAIAAAATGIVDAAKEVYDKNVDEADAILGSITETVIASTLMEYYKKLPKSMDGIPMAVVHEPDPNGKPN